MSKILDPRRGERGSAYIVVLLALVVLTIIGLSLVMVTDTEVQLGANERTLTRTLFASDSGLQVAVVRHVMGPENGAFTFIQNRSSAGGLQVAEQIQQSAFQQLSWADCDWCPTNENDQQYNDDNYTVTSTGQRLAWSGDGNSLPPSGGGKALSQTQVTTMIRVTNEAQQPLNPQSRP